jgi:hypothetical protein
LERRFNKQLNEARRKNELMIDNLKVNYENEINELKAQRGKMDEIIRSLEMENLKKQGEIDKLTSMVESEKMVSKLSSVTLKQAELVAEFLRKNGSLGKGDVRDLENSLRQTHQPSGGGKQGFEQQSAGNGYTTWYGPSGH